MNSPGIVTVILLGWVVVGHQQTNDINEPGKYRSHIISPEGGTNVKIRGPVAFVYRGRIREITHRIRIEKKIELGVLIGKSVE